MTATADTQQDALFGYVPPGFSGGDGSYPVRLPDGKLAWIFGDSLVRTPSHTDAFVHNQIVVESADGKTITTVHGGTATAPTSLIDPPSGGDRWVWPAGGFVEAGKLMVFFSEFAPPGFTLTGDHFLTAFTLPLTAAHDTPTPVTPGSVMWGSAVYVDTTPTPDMVYVFGDQDREEGGWHNHYTYVARFALGASRGFWSFWDGSTFQPNTLLAKEIQSGGANLVAQIAGVAKYGTQIAAFNIGPWSQSIDMRLAANPWGPYGTAASVYTCPDPGVYLPRVVQDGTKLQIAYSIQNSRPRFARL